VKVTLELLRKYNACREQRKLFAKTFPQGVVPTRELVRRFGDVFDLGWAAEALLTGERFNAFEDSRAEAIGAHNKAMEPVNRAYKAAIDSAWDRWNSSWDSSSGEEEREALRQEYVEASAAADVVYRAAEALLTAAYDRAVADAFYDAWVQQYPEDAA